MRVLLIKPRPEAVQFGLAPFFQTEPLGLEYIASELKAQQHSVAAVDLRFDRRSVRSILEHTRPDLVGISCLHTLDVPATLRLAADIKTLAPGAFVAVGGHAASAYPQALYGSRHIDAICAGEGERTLAAICDAIRDRRPLHQTPGLELPAANGKFSPTEEAQGWLDLDQVRPPDRAAVARYQGRYCCLNYMPVWTLETARGCPHRCKFCSVWQFYRRSHRFHAPGNVRADFEACGPHVFVVDDLFWAEPAASDELARALLAGRERKRWMLVQSRVDTVADNADLLRRWRPLTKNFDIFFGFESPNRNGLDALNKGVDAAKMVEAIQVARDLGYGVTGNFIIDPDFTEQDFAELWDFLATHKMHRVGFTILTPLPGTYFFEKIKDRIEVFDWSQYDLHHLLWRPRLPVERFFELYCETWRRSVLNAAGAKKWWRWLREVCPAQIPRLARILARTQKLMDKHAYLAESKIG